jgi:hypothetical protein
MKATKPVRITLTPTYLYHVERCTVCGNDKHVSRNAPRDFGHGPGGFVCMYCEVKEPEATVGGPTASSQEDQAAGRCN